MKHSNTIILIEACNKIISIFIGPFLVAYFIKVSADSMVDLAVYNIYSYIFIALISLYAGLSVKKNHPLATFRLGVISKFIYILVIIILKEDIVNHLNVIALLYGFSTTLFFIPYNMISSNTIENSDRTTFEARKSIIKGTIGITVPIILGTLITTTNYQITAIIVLIISAIQIVASFYFEPLPNNRKPYNLVSAFSKFKNHPQVKKLLIADFLKGLTISDGALGVIITILIINSFKTDMNLGIINSITAVLCLFANYFYSKFYKGKNDKKLLSISIILPIIGVTLICLWPSPITIIIYNIFFAVFASDLLGLMGNIRLFNVSKTNIENELQTEYWVIREIVLNVGRVVGYGLMLMIGLLGMEYLNILVIILTLSLVLFGIVTAQTDKNEN